MKKEESIYSERKQKLVQQFQQIVAQIEQLMSAREQVRGKLILIDELEKEPADNRASKRRVEKIEKKLDVKSKR